MGSNLKFHTSWELDFNKKLYKLNAAQFLCQNCATLVDLEEYLSQGIETHSDMVKHFANTNNSQAKTDLEMLVYFQECYSLAYSLKVLSSNLPKLKLVDKSGEKLSSNSNVEGVLKNLLSTQSTPTSKNKKKKSV
eukprot:TRINITY_DN1938_c0_g1_i1.p1 TRINITY_DN1938_c0_g1~~TRINITY_DN1938_c0_g1_i1.p1  ORF type:complete len:135 (+),score=15.51 TRINITY_DN1938_c0_g1_i1:233-637(+)